MTGARSHHVTYLAMAIAVLGLSFVLAPGAGDHVVVPFLPGQPAVPALCASQLFFGVPCPGCGLTRSFIAIAHGRFSQAFALHWIGVPLFLATAYQVAYRPWMIARGEWLPPPWLASTHGWIARTLIAALLVSFGVRLL